MQRVQAATAALIAAMQMVPCPTYRRDGSVYELVLSLAAALGQSDSLPGRQHVLVVLLSIVAICRSISSY